jgi:hypothetical protein
MIPSRINAILVAVGGLILLTGCMSPILMAPASTPLEGRAYVTTGKTTGEACMFSILGIPFATDASLASALKNAREMASADALIDIVVDSRYVYTFFYNRNCTIVQATGIKFTSGQAPYLPPAPAVPAIPPTPGVKETPEPVKEEVEPPPAPEVKPAVPAKPKKLTRAEKRKLAAEKRKAEREARRRAAEERKRKAAAEKKRKEEDARKKALAMKKKKPQEKPIPAQYKGFCRYQAGDQIRVETKTEVITGEFLKCAHFGIQIKPLDKPRGVVPFGQVWMVKLVGAAKPKVTPIAPIKPAPATPAEPAQPRTPAQPRKPAIPK